MKWIIIGICVGIIIFSFSYVLYRACRPKGCAGGCARCKYYGQCDKQEKD